MQQRILTIFVLFIALSQNILGQGIKWNSTYQTYIDQYKNIAIREMHRYGIPASITMAQAILESGAGRSDLAINGNNHFGIKCHGWEGRTIHHDDDLRGECFRAYDDPMDSFEDHSLFLVNRAHYRSLFQLDRTDYKGWAHGLKKAGYATSPTYARRLIDIIELYRLNELDYAKDVTMGRPANNITPPSNIKVNSTIEGGMHQVLVCNKTPYVIAHRNDTWQTIGKELGINHKKLAKFNERSHKETLKAGDIIYLDKKQTKADKSFKNKVHVVRQGESMYDIAQHYGIRLKSLYQKNNLSPDYQVKTGDRLKVY